jgi:hypothetical protein
MPTTPLSDVSAFLEIAKKKNFFNANTIEARRIAFNKFLEILDEDQQTVEYLRDHFDVVEARFTNRHPEMRGSSVDQYANRVQRVLKDFVAWKTDRSAWERDLAARQSVRTTASDSEKKRTRVEKPKLAATASAAPTEDDSTARVVKIPLPSGFEVMIKLPRDLTTADLKRVLWGLLPYASDWDPSAQSPRQVFPQLNGERDDLHT